MTKATLVEVDVLTYRWYASSMNTTEHTYEAGIELAKNDISRFGIHYAMDKLSILDGDLAEGYHEGIYG